LVHAAATSIGDGLGIGTGAGEGGGHATGDAEGLAPGAVVPLAQAKTRRPGRRRATVGTTTAAWGRRPPRVEALIRPLPRAQHHPPRTGPVSPLAQRVEATEWDAALVEPPGSVPPWPFQDSLRPRDRIGKGRSRGSSSIRAFWPELVPCRGVRGGSVCRQ
jgi:hypothetical protein